MPNKEEAKRKRMVVEEVKADETTEPKVKAKEEVKVADIASEPKILDEAAKDAISENCQEVRPLDTPIKPKKSPSVALWIIIPGIFLLGTILGGIVFYQRGVNRDQVATATPTTKPPSSPLPSLSPSPSSDLTKYSVSIFNGSGIAGEAGRAKTLLTAAGFKVGTTANAATYDYTKTIIKAKNTVDASFMATLSAALGKSFVVDTAQTLASTSADTIQIVIGSSKAQ